MFVIYAKDFVKCLRKCLRKDVGHRAYTNTMVMIQIFVMQIVRILFRLAILMKYSNSSPTMYLVEK